MNSKLIWVFLGELPEAEELMAAYETQKIVIAQLQEQIYDEKMRNTEIEGIYIFWFIHTFSKLNFQFQIAVYDFFK